MRRLIMSLALAGALFFAVAPYQALHATTYYYLTDHLGTPQLLTDKNQQVVWRGVQEPFGKNLPTTNLVEQNLRFPGQYFDEESELHYNYFRTYDPTVGRFLQSDPIGLDDGLSTYAYVGNAPTTYLDQDGLSRRRAGPSPMQGIVRVEVEILIRKITQLDPSFTYQSHRHNSRPGARYTQRDVNILTGIYQRASSTGFCGVGVANASPAPYSLSGTNLRHSSEIITRGPNAGQLQRPFMNSNLFIREIVQTGRGRPDPQGTSSTRYDVPGTFRGSSGTWELLVSPSGSVQHFNFTTR